jgi:hypothetical protein
MDVEQSVLSVFDTSDFDIQYYYAEPLPGDPTGGIEDVHFHPVAPRRVRMSLGWGL